MKKREMIRNTIKIVSAFSFLTIISCANSSEVNKICDKEIADVKIGQSEIIAQTACTNEKQAKGLMFVENLNRNEGMLFVFEKEQILSFWMKNTLIPLDIIFINKNKEIVGIKSMKPNDLTPVSSDKNSSYALEVNEGVSKKNNWKIGDKITIN